MPFSTEDIVQIPKIVYQRFFGDRDLEILKVPKAGVSGTNVVLVRSKGLVYALKFGVGQTPLHRLIAKRDILARFKPMTEHLVTIRDYCTYDEGGVWGEALLMDAVIGPSLHDLAVAGQPLALDVQQSILTAFRAVWKESRRPFGGTLLRDPKARAVKASVAMAEVLARYGIGQQDPLVINGVELGSLATLAPMFERYEYPAFQVICQQDLIGDNFLIDDARRWYAIDLEWVGWHDWKSSASRAYGWWKTMASEGFASIHRLQHGVEITYELTLPETCRRLEDICLQSFRSTSAELDENADWAQMFWLLVGYSLLAQLRFSKDRRREQFDLPILAEGLLTLVKSADTGV